ncbi:MAG TPA: 16S rRNA (guanine(966)-N(2))-methyltransferase RsmD [Candidatus Saccharimonadia bacterium]|nr:16S rRNA (guanine(966)-N(2))-methyltransferase RsmD [Candidatus Saccharimonadia bacterium]
MRVIAGTLGGRQFNAPRGHHTHPMSDKVRGALFNALGDIAGLTVLDAFAGSGALSIEALSRGASHATAIDSEKAAQQAISQSIRSLNLASRTKLIKATANAWLSTTDESFDIVLLDPPYDDIQPNLLLKLVERTKPGGIVVLSLPPQAGFKLPGNFELLVSKNYGDAGLAFYRRQA